MDRIYVVVESYGGLINYVTVFDSEDVAVDMAEIQWAKMNPEKDDVKIFSGVYGELRVYWSPKVVEDK